MKTLVMKFGGSALGTLSALSQVLSIVIHENERWERVLIVASALDGVTDMLLEAAQWAQVANERGYRRIAATLRTRHRALVDKLPLGTQERNALHIAIDTLLFEMLDQCQNVASIPTETLTPDVSDRIVNVGERLAARIVAALLRQNQVRGVAIDGTDLIVTDALYGNATPLMNATSERIERDLLPMLEREIVPVVTGFIGSTVEGNPTTLGRGGSDYTASVLGVCAQADEVWIWSDVDGLMSADPSEVPEARIIERLSYDEVAELAYFGAQILHARMIRPLREKGIPLYIKNVYKPQQPGTRVHDQPKAASRIKAVTSISGVALSANRSGSIVHMMQFIEDTFLEAVSSHSDVMISAQSATHSLICAIIPTSVGGIEAAKIVHRHLENKLRSLEDTATWDAQAVSIVTAIGDEIEQGAVTSARILQCLQDMPILGFSQGPARCSLSIILQPDDVEQAVQRIHPLTLNTG